MEKDKVSEEVIMEVASQVFMEKGMAGARMQEIADRANINKAMLHYYFRSKEKLFDEVFKNAFQKFWPSVEAALLSAHKPEEVFQAIIDAYIRVLMESPYLANFILNEIQRDPDHLEKLMRETGLKPKMMLAFIESLIENGFLVKVDPREFMVNVLSLCLFPFAGQALISRLLWDNDSDSYQTFLSSRRDSIMHLIQKTYFIQQV
ncbi:TetR/AcrR family transcriptional regulator [Carboxylicivirga sp. N1Y90]|uniref:TetR/AcrR family transcriptional regulator n=1 Tax=Carboxylicivirga fragile TaxID=3417571 RepID=UPI003D34F75B|nr:TetR/AcrR family transcriptional regulator [Marinilabiliaceae bacterium N1Y90]